MRTGPAAATTPRRRRHLRLARIAVASGLVRAAPFAGRAAHDPPSDPPRSAGSGPSAGTAPAGGSDEGVGGDDRPIRGVPVPLADPALAELLQPGDLVDLVGTADTGPAGDPGAVPVLVARAVRVRNTPDTRGGGRTILVEVPVADAARVAATAAGTPLAVPVHG